MDGVAQVDGNGNGQVVTGFRPRRDSRQAELMALVIDQREAILDALVADVAARRGGPLGRDEAAQAREAMGWVFDTFNACVVEGRDLRPDEIAWFEARGAARQAQGMPLPDVLDGLRRAFDHCYVRLTDRVDESPRPTSAIAMGVARALYDLRDAALAALERGYGAAERDQANGASIGAAPVLRALLDGTVDEDTVRAQFRQLGREVRSGASLLVAAAPGEFPTGALSGLLADLAGAVPGVVAGLVQATPVPHVVVLAADGPGRSRKPERAAGAAAARHGAAVYAIPEASLTLAGELYRRLRPHVAVADLLADDGVVSVDELAVWHLYSFLPPEEVVRFVSEAAGPLVALRPDKSAEWRETLETFWRTGGNVSATARLLPCDSSTVHRRLARVARLTGLDARELKQGRRLRLALYLMDVHAGAVPPFGDAAWSDGTAT